MRPVEDHVIGMIQSAEGIMGCSVEFHLKTLSILKLVMTGNSGELTGLLSQFIDLLPQHNEACTILCVMQRIFQVKTKHTCQIF
jgi:hypothetical protein